MYDIQTVVNHLAEAIIYQQPASVGQLASPPTGWSQGAPHDYYLTSAEIQLELTNVAGYPVTVWLYEMMSRYDSVLQIYDDYADSLTEAGHAGTLPVSTLVASEWIDTIPGSTPFKYRNLCMNWKCLRAKSFRVGPAQTKKFRFSMRKRVHITPRFQTLVSMRGTRFIHMNVRGAPVGSSIGSTINSSSCGIVTKWTTTHHYEINAQPYRQNNVVEDSALVSAQWLNINDPTVVSTLPMA